ncbi:uncharacterized protein LOC110380373 [Helicoverpa armigera]|uniref:Uncharacterized protein n=1 Tax=Helicoverpa armigera TaxID=29058 RepID=A0A2W1BPT1_HELAM|nr:uncharacterized protein LOC110380373 [Helicoverpa armigera]PZC73693.1 hypothetical protein B5X24_HaOG208964 [Helicoverpa armigera]
MFTWSWLFGIVVLAALAGPGRAQPSAYPANITTCEQFERSARFNPYALIDSMWKIFYFWSNNTELTPIVFALAGKSRVRKFRDFFETTNPGLGVEWEKATLFMNPRPGVEVLFLHASTPGAFRAIVKKEQRDKVRPQPEPLIKFADVRMKLVDRYLAMMCCEDMTAYAMAKIPEMPKTEEKCKKAAEHVGYQGYEGRSYLELLKYNDEL